MQAGKLGETLINCLGIAWNRTIRILMGITTNLESVNVSGTYQRFWFATGSFNHPFRKRTCPPTKPGAQVPFLNSKFSRVKVVPRTEEIGVKPEAPSPYEMWCRRSRKRRTKLDCRASTIAEKVRATPG
jgi:hypothetical protein